MEHESGLCKVCGDDSQHIASDETRSLVACAACIDVGSVRPYDDPEIIVTRHEGAALKADRRELKRLIRELRRDERRRRIRNFFGGS